MKRKGKKRGPWTVRSSRVIYSNPWVSFSIEDVIQPDGKPGEYGIVDYKHGAFTVALDAQHRVTLVRVYQYATGKYSLELPGGGYEKGETMLAAAKRELAEEAGLRSRQWTRLGYIEPLTSLVRNFRNYLFLARNCMPTALSRDGTEVIETKKVAFAEALRMVRVGTITCGTTVAGLLRARDVVR